MNVQEILKEPRDTGREHKAAKWLRSLDEYKKFEIIWDVLRKNQIVGLALVKKANLQRAHLEVILEYGLVYGDASSVYFWYQATVEGLGENRTIDIVASHLNNGPLIIEKMLYWLRPENETEKAKVNNLKIEFGKMYPKFKSTRSTGIHATGA